MSDYSELKRLAEAATPQKFDTAEEKSGNGYIECPHCGGSGEVELEADYCNYDGVAIGVQFYGIGHEFGAAEAYYRAANPAAVLALIAENERLGLELKDFQWGASVEAEAGDEARTEVSKLRAENAGLRTGYQAYERVNAELKAEVEKIDSDRKSCWAEFKVQGRRLDELKAENDALRQDAERYKFLMLSFVGDEGSPQAGYYVIYEDGSGFGEILCGDEATREIDTAMAQGAQS